MKLSKTPGQKQEKTFSGPARAEHSSLDASRIYSTDERDAGEGRKQQSIMHYSTKL